MENFYVITNNSKDPALETARIFDGTGKNVYDSGTGAVRGRAFL
jgi:hypothetical protein